MVARRLDGHRLGRPERVARTAAVPRRRHDAAARDRHRWNGSELSRLPARRPRADIPRGPTNWVNGLYAVGVDGHGLRTIVPYTSPMTRLGASLSPDGTKIAFTVWDGSIGTVHVVDVATGRDTIPAFDPPSGGGVIDEFSGWSPDGSRLMFGRYHGSSTCPHRRGAVNRRPRRRDRTGHGHHRDGLLRNSAPMGRPSSRTTASTRRPGSSIRPGRRRTASSRSTITERSSWQRLAP